MELNVWIALWAGLVSFVSPCTLPLYPSYLSYITGVSVQQLKEDTSRAMRMRTLTHTLFFILGFSVIYYAMGATANILAETFVRHRELISKLAGIVIIVMGLVLLGVFKPKLLMREWKPKVGKRAGYFGSFLVGIGFAAGWSPCVGPILGMILTLSATSPGSWFSLITAYSLGFAIPFFVLAFFLGSTRWLLRYSQPIMKVGGCVMVALGIMLYTGHLWKLSVWLQSITPDWMIV
jgi:cytochrome c-type biogenesis protein